MLKVAYLNVYGLAMDKLENLQNTFDANDVTILAETWHAAKHVTQQHPYFFVHSPTQATRRLTRQSGGLAIFANPLLHRSISILRTNEFFLTVRVGTTVITGIYFPPSMSDDQFHRLLNAVSNSDIVVGDINVAYGREFGVPVSGPPGKRAIVDQWCLAFNFRHLQPMSGTTRWDHLFTRQQAEFKVVPTPVLSDHPLLLCRVEPTRVGLEAIAADNDNNENKKSVPTRRFLLRRLADVQVVQQLQEMYNNSSGDYEQLVANVMTDLPTLEVEDRLARVDELDVELMTTVQQTAERVLGTYSVNVQRKQPDRALVRMVEAGTQLAAVQTYKRMCRATAPVLSSADPAKELETEIRDHFQQVFQTPNIPEPPENWMPDHKTLFDRRLKLSADTLWSFGVGDRDWMREFSERRTRRFIQKYDKTKACGSDSIHTKLLSGLLDSNFVRHLSVLYSVCALTGLTPTRWNTSTIYPLKKNEDSRHIAQCRPIALTEMFRRVFEGLLLRAVMRREDCKSMVAIHPTQAGFRVGHSTLLQAALSNDLSTQTPRPINIFIDFKQAYDKVPIELLIQKLKTRNVTPIVTSLVLSLFTRCKICVVANGQRLGGIETYSGLFQGSLLSPLLFLIFIDDLATKLASDATPALPDSLLFADDLQLKASDGQKAQILCDKTTAWSNHNSMVINIQKCGTTTPELSLSLQEQPVPYVEVYPYLGFPHKAYGIDIHLHMNNNATKAGKTLNFVQRVGGEWPEWIKMTIYKTFIRPRLEYGGQLAIYRPLSLELVEQTQQDALKWIIPYAPHHQAVSAVTALLPLDIRLSALAATFGQHCENMALDHPARRLLAEVVGPPPWNESLLLPRVCNNRLYSHFKRLANQNDSTLTTIARRWQLEQLEEHTPYARYIARQCRRNTYGPDKLLFWGDAETRQKAVAWRVGSLYWNKTCPNGHQFKRSCIRNCILAANVPEHNRRRPINPPQHYCVLDHLLNLEEYDLAGTAIVELAALLG